MPRRLILRPIKRVETIVEGYPKNSNSIKKESNKMQETLEKINDKTSVKDGMGDAPAFKPSISIRRKQTRRIALQVDEEKADSFDEYVRFVSECSGYEVSAGDVMNEILKAHFTRDGGFKQWRAVAGKNGTASSV